MINDITIFTLFIAFIACIGLLAHRNDGKTVRLLIIAITLVILELIAHRSNDNETHQTIERYD